MTTMKRATTYKARFPGTYAVQCFQRFTEYFINYHFVGSTMPFLQASLHHSCQITISSGQRSNKRFVSPINK